MDEKSVVTDEERQNVLKKLVKDLVSVAPGRAISVLSRDPLTGSFHGMSVDQRSTLSVMDFLDRTDPVIGRLLGGEEWVRREHEQ